MLRLRRIVSVLGAKPCLLPLPDLQQYPTRKPLFNHYSCIINCFLSHIEADGLHVFKLNMVSCYPEIIQVLHREPTLWGTSQGFGKPQGHLWAYPASTLSPLGHRVLILG